MVRSDKGILICLTFTSTLLAVVVAIPHWWKLTCFTASVAIGIITASGKPDFLKKVYLKPEFRPAPLTVSKQRKNVFTASFGFVSILALAAVPLIFFPAPSRVQYLILMAWHIWASMAGLFLGMALRQFLSIKRDVERHNEWLARMGPRSAIPLDF
ncbi:MAG TPA: hypothetical protein VF463_13260 [Sphingobium sp.]